MPIDPGAVSHGEPMQPIKPEEEPSALVGKPMTKLKAQQTLNPKQAAEVYQKVLVKQLLMQSLRELQKEQKKQKEIERGNV